MSNLAVIIGAGIVLTVIIMVGKSYYEEIVRIDESNQNPNDRFVVYEIYSELLELYERDESNA